MPHWQRVCDSLPRTKQRHCKHAERPQPKQALRGDERVPDDALIVRGWPQKVGPQHAGHAHDRE